MAKPRVFVSSTFYDLKDIRSSLDSFIRQMGMEPVRAEAGDITYGPDRSPEQSCYLEAGNADIFVLIIGGRYGSASTHENGEVLSPEEIISITRKEYRHAVLNEIPLYILVKSEVLAEYETWCKNMDTEKVIYAHVDDIGVYRFINEVFQQKGMNPVEPFEYFADIETWLRKQWGGLFGQLLGQRSRERELSSLSIKVHELGELNKTLRRYLEEIIKNLKPREFESIIRFESERLEKEKEKERLWGNNLVRFLMSQSFLTIDEVEKFLCAANSKDAALAYIQEEWKKSGPDKFISHLSSLIRNMDIHSEFTFDLNEARALLGLHRIDDLAPPNDSPHTDST